MIFVELVTIAHIPPFSEVTLRTDKDEWEINEIAGTYQNDRWIFELADPKYLTGFLCKFALNRQIWSNGNDFNIPGTDNERHTFYLNQLALVCLFSPLSNLVKPRLSFLIFPLQILLVANPMMSL